MVAAEFSVLGLAFDRSLEEQNGKRVSWLTLRSPVVFHSCFLTILDDILMMSQRLTAAWSKVVTSVFYS